MTHDKGGHFKNKGISLIRRPDGSWQFRNDYENGGYYTVGRNGMGEASDISLLPINSDMIMRDVELLQEALDTLKVLLVESKL